MSISSQKPSLQQQAQIERSGADRRALCARDAIDQLCRLRRRSRGRRSLFFREPAQDAGDEAGRSGLHHRQHHRDDPSRRPASLSRGDRRAFQGQHAALRSRFPLSRRRRQLALVPPVRRRGQATRRPRVPDRRRDVRRHRGAPARPRTRDREGRGGRRLSAGRQRRTRPRRRPKSATRSRWS